MRHLIPPAFASKYFYDRAAHMASEGKLQAALAEVDRGLDYRVSSELHLLGGILAKRISDFDLMRQHVAAIPLDDVLRQEAEWLLRSHQTRQRTLRQADKARKTTNRVSLSDPEEAPLPFMVDEVAPSPVRPARANNLWVGLVVVLLVAGIGWIIFGRNALGLRFLTANGNTPTTAASEYAENGVTATIPAADIQPALILTPTLAISVTPEIPNNIAQRSATPEPLAANTPRSVIEAIDTRLFDFKGFLLQKERQDLAQLDVSGSLQGTKLKLKGIVPMAADRSVLIDVAQSAPDVTEVDAVDLLVRLPPTYTVQTGDTIWDITYKLYGDVSRMQALIDANADVLPSPEALRIGMELKVPPNQ
ncbi:MAG: LysM peptidoglycan-binding domain-containing protein [Chloroflexi bacterium]|nr:LysM peptidoglycan-binding domain-containing protein [Chloroflexota bacterium]